MPATVVYIHGNGNKAARDVLKDQWDRSLFGRNVGDRSRMAYWASLRYPTPLPAVVFDEVEHAEADDVPVGDGGAGGLEGLVDDAAHGRSVSVETVPAPADLDPAGLAAEARLEAVSIPGPGETGLEGLPSPAEAAEPTALDPWLTRMAYTADAVVAGEELTDATGGLEALPLPRAARIALFRALVKVTFKDVHAYFFGGFGEPMRQVLRDTLRAAPDPVIVVSHSLGTIIAYDVLREPAFAHRVIPLFLTAGSPLGTAEVQDVVRNPLEVPAGVRAWRNVADARDVVALDRTIRPEYRPDHKCTDFLVVNDSDNHHGIRQYLSTRPVRESVAALFD
jgi:hypothetical protein